MHIFPNLVTYVIEFGKTCIVHTSDFRKSIKLQGMVYRFETFRDNKGVVALQSLKISHLSLLQNKFYESPNLKNWMCEQCTFSQIQSHIIKSG